MRTRTVEERIAGKNPKRCLPQWRRTAAVQRQRMVTYAVGAVVLGAIGIGAFWLRFVPLWLQWVCLIGLPIQIIGFFADRHLYLAALADVAELEQLIAAAEEAAEAQA